MMTSAIGFACGVMFMKLLYFVWRGHDEQIAFGQVYDHGYEDGFSEAKRQIMWSKR